ncbi:MAG: hypothetical protein CMJ18_14770 [Phycisphaeraceae bacterium]|nr:hypothetical protein [Phycisphaeraceae bacterium]
MRLSFAPWLIVTSLLLALGVPAPADDTDQTTQSAIFLLRRCRKRQRDYRGMATGSTMLRALRQLGDPELAPFFRALIDTERPWLTVHGILGLAECSEDQRIDLSLISEMENELLQRMVLSAAMDLDLIDVAQVRQVMAWSDLHESVSVLAAVHLIGHGEAPDLDALRSATESEKLGRASLAALLMVQSGETGYGQQLTELSESDHPDRDKVREHLLRTSFKSEFDLVGPWALSISEQEDADPRMRRLALQVALRFNTSGAVQTWRKQFLATADHVERIRLALVALNVSHWAQPRLFETLIESSDALLEQIGRTGQAVASRKEIVTEVGKAIEQNHQKVSDWALDYAHELAEKQDARHILLAIILAFEGPPRNLARRLKNSIAATSTLMDHDPDAAKEMLRPILLSPETDTRLKRGILAGLVQSRKQNPMPIIEGVPLAHPQDYQLTLLIRARQGLDLSEEDLENLALMVRGGGKFSPHLRLQAAWTYLKYVDRTEMALEAALQ